MAAKRRPDGFPKVTLKNITRPEPKFFGWRVNVKRGQKDHIKYFPDGSDGPFDSLRAAVQWRDEMWMRLGPPMRTSPSNARNTSGVVGVRKEFQRTSDSHVTGHWVAKWIDAGRRRRGRSFSVDKYGEEEARERAIAARKAGVAATRRVRQLRLRDTLHTHERLLRPKGRSG